ncbi:MAG: branched-chain amino acid ABC transporter permease [Oscillospiraceae bacterium]
MKLNDNNRFGKIFTIAVVAAIFVAVLLIEQIQKPSGNVMMFLTVVKKASVYAIVVVSMNLLNGFTGLFSLGQAGFMLIGAYTYAIFTIPAGVRDSVYKYYDALVRFSFPEVLQNAMGGFGMILGVIIALILAGAAAAFVAWLIGLPVLRLKSDYLAIATLGFAEIIRAIFIWGKLGPVTNGSNPLKNFVRLNAFKIHFGDTTINLTAFTPLLIAAICVGIIILIVNSSYGRAFKAIREDEIAAEAMGINLAKHKMLAFCTSSFFAGVGGAMLAMFASTVQASNFKSALTYEILLIVVLGGIGSITGSCIGSFLYIAASEWWLRNLDSGTFLGIAAPGIFRNGFRLVVFSVIIMIVVLFFRNGIMGTRELPDLFVRKKAKTKAEKEEAAVK